MSSVRLSRIVLVGFMGAGKSSVGRALAERLGWRFVDADDAVEETVGLPVPEIFRRHGEDAFREWEAETVDEILSERCVVVATGGGWAAREGRLNTLPEGTVSVWLRVSAEEAVRRTRDDVVERPLLGVDDPMGRARALLRARKPRYAEATLGVDTEGRTVDDVTARICRMLAETGWEIDAP